jgi:hypothetical protein
VSPANWPQRFRVVLDDEAAKGLTQAFAAYFPTWQGARVTNADNIIRYMLADDPERNGQHVSEDLFRLVVSPLQVLFELHRVSRVAMITAIGFFPV